MVTLYDFELSGSCYKIRLLMHVLDVPYKTVTVDFVNKEHKTDKYLKLNAFGSIPIFEDDGLRLRDSAGMLVYLAKKYDKKNYWYPDDAAAMGLIQQWMATGRRPRRVGSRPSTRDFCGPPRSGVTLNAPSRS